MIKIVIDEMNINCEKSKTVKKNNKKKKKKKERKEKEKRSKFKKMTFDVGVLSRNRLVTRERSHREANGDNRIR